MRIKLKTHVDDENEKSTLTKKSIKYNKTKHDIAHNGVFMRKDRLSTVLIINIKGDILEIIGENPKKLKLNRNIYD